MDSIIEVIRRRHSCRVAFDPQRPVPRGALSQVLEAARWAPTAHNIQNFEIIVIDDAALLSAISAIRVVPTAAFLAENYDQLSFSEEELLKRKTGLLANMFPPNWLSDAARRGEPAQGAMNSLDHALPVCPALLIVVHDARKRAPASEGDALGMMSLGCVMQNIWLMAEALGIASQIVSALGTREAAAELGRILGIPEYMRIAFACRLGYPLEAPGRYLRVRRDLSDLVHRNAFGQPWWPRPAQPSAAA